MGLEASKFIASFLFLGLMLLISWVNNTFFAARDVVCVCVCVCVCVKERERVSE